MVASGVIESNNLTRDADIGSHASTGVFQQVKVPGVVGKRIFTVVAACGPAEAGLAADSKRSYMEMMVLGHAVYVRDAIRVGAWALPLQH